MQIFINHRQTLHISLNKCRDYVLKVLEQLVKLPRCYETNDTEKNQIDETAMLIFGFAQIGGFLHLIKNNLDR